MEKQSRRGFLKNAAKAAVVATSAVMISEGQIPLFEIDCIAYI